MNLEDRETPGDNRVMSYNPIELAKVFEVLILVVC